MIDAMAVAGRRRLITLAAVLALLSSVCWADETDAEDGSCADLVLELTDDGFQEAVKNAEMLVVMFYTPW